MPDVAAAIRAEGVRPGIWFRPLLRRDGLPSGVRGPRDGAFALDPSAPEVLDLVADDVRRLTGWGFELVKHDFSTYDLLGRWGPAMAASPALDGWTLADPAVTTAEALVRFYTRIRDAAGGALVLGCNVVGHLAAGLVDAQRTGDDTSGRNWDRTRRMGVNTLAFRVAQHGAFFAVDADCVPSTRTTDWAMNRQFLDLVARSGTALFVSVDPATRTDAVDADLSAGLRLALDGGAPGGIEPLDWLSTPTPRRWRSGDEEVTYSWIGPLGADPFAASL
jgi:alpha-galactosidase